jgi:hypothetical protein
MVSSFLWLWTQGLECSFLVLMSPVGWGLILITMVCGHLALRDKRWPSATWLHLAWPLLMTGVCCGWGQANEHAPGGPDSPGPLRVLEGLLALYVAGSGAIISVNRQARAATAAVLSIGAIPVLGCAFVASMAITGSWL